MNLSGNAVAKTLTITALCLSFQIAGLAQEVSGLERRKAIEAEYGVKEAVTRYDTRTELMENPAGLCSDYCMYSFVEHEISPAPSGYKPFYISYFGRHGARFALSDDIYEKIHKVLLDAHIAGKLNDRGERLWKEYEEFYPSVAHRGGDLTPKGQEQLRRIAGIMYRNFPQVFKGRTVASILSTPIPRTMLTMFSFVDELRGLDKDFSFTVDAGRCYFPILEPNKSISPIKVKVPLPEEAVKSAKKFAADKIDAKSFCSKFFNDTDYLEATYGMWKFESDMRNIVCDVRCLKDVPEDTFSDVFTTEELFGIWEVRNYNGYIYMGRTPLSDNKNCINNSSILKSIIEQADADIASGERQLCLRFSHDTALLPLMCFMRLDNFGAVVDDPEKVKNYWRSDFIPMAANLQLIFYRSRKSADILVKVLYNGREASLPLSEAAPSFYRWTEFKAYYQALMPGGNN